MAGKKRSAQKPRDFDDGWGFDKFALKACMSMAGYDGSAPQLARLLGCSLRQAERRFNRGSFTRHDIAVLVYKLRMSGDQVIDTFFNGRYPGYMDISEGHVTYGLEGVNDEMLRWLKAELEKEESGE